MITHLHAKNFKSWRDTGEMRLAPLTGLFGPNSSGKTGILQMLLLLKQTAESTDRSRVLHLGDQRTYADLGTTYDVTHQHTLPETMYFSVGWKPSKPLRILDPQGAKGTTLFKIEALNFEADIAVAEDTIAVSRFAYDFNDRGQENRFGMQRQEEQRDYDLIVQGHPQIEGLENLVFPRDFTKPDDYDLIVQGYEMKRTPGRPWPLPAPVKCYGFPDRVNADYQNAGFLSSLALAFEELMHGVYYLGPLRAYPYRTYGWSGEQPQDVGRRGDYTVAALLAARKRGTLISRGSGRKRQTLEERVAQWLKDLGVIHSFEVRQVAPNRKEYEVRVRTTAQAAEVSLLDVGFGVSQVLPVLTLCYYAPKGSTIILEQPEIHLHPSVQAGLADVFVDAIKWREVQIIVESHSEHLLRRLQRRIAEEELLAEDTALYFTTFSNSESHLSPLALDLFGNITNWPQGFFGDAMGDMVAMSEAEMRRRQEPVA